MNRPPEIEQIEARFGRTFTTLEAIGPYMAFRTSIDEPQVTISPAGSEFPLDRVIQTAGEHCLWCHSLGYAVFVGLPDDVGPPSLYAIAGADPIRLMAVFDVGNHNDFTGDTPARARRYMAALLTTDPFVPYFADPAGFKVRFIDHVTAARARDIAGAVLEFDPDAVALGEALDDIEEAGDIDIRDALGRVIHRRQRLELWWD
jgi:hypothetical protein